MIGEDNPLNYLLDDMAAEGHQPGWATITSVTPLRVRKDHEANALEVTPQSLVQGLQVGDRVMLAEWQGQPVILGRAGGPDDSGRVVSSNSNAWFGYIRYADRRQEAWVRITSSLGGTLWTNGIYYSDVEMGDWPVPFARLDRWYATIGSLQYWTSTGGQSTTSAGTVRAYRPTSNVSTGYVVIHGYGTW